MGFLKKGITLLFILFALMNILKLDSGAASSTGDGTNQGMLQCEQAILECPR